MIDLDAHYLRVRDFAERFNLDESTVYKKIDRGEIEAIRIGKTIRIPSSELARYLNPVRVLDEEAAADNQPANLGDRVVRFEARTGLGPRAYVEAWRSGEIEDTPTNARHAIEALALRAALEQPTPAR